MALCLSMCDGQPGERGCLMMQIRNTACLGGNICTGSPISDLNPIWMACRATFDIVGQGTEARTVPARGFFLGYR